MSAEEFDWSKVKVRQVVGSTSRATAARRAKSAGTWAQIPHDRGLKLAKRLGNPVLAVLLALEQAVHDARSNCVKLTNELLGRYRISQQSKNRALRQLVAADVVTVEWHGRAAPTVTHHWYTKGGELKGVRRI
jgi:hypothetical protein